MEVNEYRKELQTKINQEKFCWVCGRNDLLTNHHIIPQKIKGVKMNLTIPMCQNCQKIIHKDDEFMSLLRRIYL